MIRITTRMEDAALRDALNGAVKRVQVALDDILKPVADEVYQNAKHTMLFEDLTGNLRRSIRLRQSKFPDGGWIIIASGGKGYKGYHANVVELGHRAVDGSWVQGRFFLRSAKTEGVRRMLQVLSSAGKVQI